MAIDTNDTALADLAKITPIVLVVIILARSLPQIGRAHV